MANVIIAAKTYATYDGAMRKLLDVVGPNNLNKTRYLIAVHPQTKRFVPTLIGSDNIPYAQHGIMVIG